MLGSGDVLSVGNVERLPHLDAKAGTVSEEHGELGHTCLGYGVMLPDWRAPAQLKPDANSADVAAIPLKIRCTPPSRSGECQSSHTHKTAQAHQTGFRCWGSGGDSRGRRGRLGSNLLGEAGEEGLGEVLGERGG